MCYQSMFGRLAVVLGVFLAAEGGASADVVPVALNLVSGGGYNEFSLTLDAGALGAPNQVSAATGNIPAELDMTFDPATHAPTVTGITFPEQNPGSISLSNMHFDFLYGLEVADSQNLKASYHTLTAPGPVSGNSFPMSYHELVISSGTIVTDGIYGYNLDLGAQPLRSGASFGSPGTITVTEASILGNTVTYNAELLLPVSLNQQMSGNPTMTAIGSGAFHAIGSFSQTFEAPEPGMLGMFLGFAATLVGYCCWKRRGYR
jgi:hypothetical protein